MNTIITATNVLAKIIINFKLSLLVASFNSWTLVHQKLALEAAERGVSMNRLVSAKLAM